MTLIGYIANEVKILIACYQHNRFESKKNKAIAQAVDLATGSGRKHMVLLIGGKIIILTKQRAKHMIDTRKFRKGTTIADLERKAIFVTK